MKPTLTGTCKENVFIAHSFFEYSGKWPIRHIVGGALKEVISVGIALSFWLSLWNIFFLSVPVQTVIHCSAETLKNHQNHLMNSEDRSCKYERTAHSVSLEHLAVTQNCNQINLFTQKEKNFNSVSSFSKRCVCSHLQQQGGWGCWHCGLILKPLKVKKKSLNKSQIIQSTVLDTCDSSLWYHFKM